MMAKKCYSAGIVHLSNTIFEPITNFQTELSHLFSLIIGCIAFIVDGSRKIHVAF